VSGSLYQISEFLYVRGHYAGEAEFQDILGILHDRE